MLFAYFLLRALGVAIGLAAALAVATAMVALLGVAATLGGLAALYWLWASAEEDTP